MMMASLPVDVKEESGNRGRQRLGKPMNWTFMMAAEDNRRRSIIVMPSACG